MSIFETSREIGATPSAIFAAFANAARLANWWGPKDFRNTFKVCEFKPGGAWQFIMHGPNGIDYANESEFLEIETDRKIVIQHTSQPRFRLTVTLSPNTVGTLLTWSQVFEDPTLAEVIKHIIVPSNEQNLDRLIAELGAVGHKPA